MKKILPFLMAMCVAAGGTTALAQEAAYDLDAAKLMDQWVYIDTTTKLSPMGEDQGVEVPVYPCYGLMDVVYCADPESAEIQQLDIYVPTEYVAEAKDNGDGTFSLTFDEEATFTNLNGTTYTVNTAPVIYQNTIDGYKEGYSITLGTDTKGIYQNADETGNSIYGDYVQAGYIYVCVGSRGVDSEGLASGGIAPDQVVDLKAGVRYLKANDEVLPGDSDKIIAIGGSAGGSCAALLGVSGNAKVFEPYLEEIGAIMDATDDIYGARVQAPIANVDKADMAYEYLHSTETQYHQMGPDGGSDKTFDDFQVALQAELILAFEEYLTELGFDSVTFRDGYLEAINKALEVYVTNHLDEEQFGDAQGFADAFEGISYVDGKVTADSMEAFVSNFMGRSKGIMAFDTEECKSWETKLFGAEHFSASLLAVLEKMAGEGNEEAARLVEAYTQEDTGVNSEGKQDLVKMMACMTYLTGEEEADIARHWRFNNSTMDGDVGSMMGYLMSRYMSEQLGIEDVDFYLGIDKISKAGHGYPDYCFLDVEAYLDEMVQG